jgi:hypothetical protein
MEPTTTTITWKRDGRGRQVSADGRYAVEADGYEPGQHVGATGDWEYGSGYEGFIAGEWAAIIVATDDNIDWFSTMREAKAACERHARSSA